MLLFHAKIETLWKLLSAVWCSIKRRNIFTKVRLELEIIFELSSLDVGTMWSSTYERIKKTNKACQGFSNILQVKMTLRT